MPLLASELVQVHLMGTPAVANEHAASAAADMMHAALLKRTQHTQAVQLHAVAMRLKHEQATVAALRTQLDDMEDRADEAEEEVGVPSRGQ